MVLLISFLVALMFLSKVRTCLAISTPFMVFLLSSMYDLNSCAWDTLLSGGWFMSGFIYLMTLLTILLMLLVTLVSMKPEWKFLSLNIMALSSIIAVFMTSGPLQFYIFFELTLVPMSLYIMAWGYQPERLAAASSMFMYTLIGSLPLLIIVLFLYKEGYQDWKSLARLWPMSGSPMMGGAQIALLLGFLVKFPMYGLHLWLPKAHVEAPVGGSMALAGLMLKLGGYGLIMFHSLISFYSLKIYMLMSASGGAVLISFLCLRQIDLKVLIAYSSVAHMSVCILGLLAGSSFLQKGSVLMMLAHGVSSPLMFLSVFYFYLRSHSRSFLMNSGMGAVFSSIGIYWFLICGANMAMPPTINFLSEMVCISGALAVNKNLIFMLGLLVFLAGAYSMALFGSTFQGQASKSLKSGAHDLSLSEGLALSTSFTLLVVPRCLTLVLV